MSAEKNKNTEPELDELLANPFGMGNSGDNLELAEDRPKKLLDSFS